MTVLDLLLLIFSLSTLPLASAVSFDFFNQMFDNGQHQQRQQQNVRSDSVWYQQQYEAAPCDRYLCPGTLSCVHFPHHCPCAFPANEDKIELGDGIAICASKGGWKAGEVARKVELARQGLL